MNRKKHIVLNGKLIPEDQGLVSPANRGMMYGDGCFETLRSYNGKFLKWDAHFNRLKDGMDYLGMNTPFSSAELFDMAAQLLQKNQLTVVDAILRIQCWREGERGYAASSQKPSFLIQTMNIHQSQEPIRLKITETRCIPNVALDRRFKLSNGLNYIKAAQEANRADCSDALMLTVNNFISETTTSNVFWIKDDTIFTPAAECDLLPGITRSIVLELCSQLRIPVQEGFYDISDIEHAEAVFCTNSLIELKEVERINEMNYATNHPIYLKLLKAFKRYKSGKLKA